MILKKAVRAWKDKGCPTPQAVFELRDDIIRIAPAEP